MIKRQSIHSRNRRRLSPGQYPAGVNANVALTIVTTALTLTADRPVQWHGMPTKLTVGALTFSNFVAVSDLVAHITLSATGAGAAYSLGANDPAIRTYSGGYANAHTGTFPA